mmetsp:Transcript_14295/g.27868  ORF Transcript_14295/g.27868 Transcript_14295/m.27868 type:complete len:207 (-) Transcript_14295:1255-1875(-)
MPCIGLLSRSNSTSDLQIVSTPAPEEPDTRRRITPTKKKSNQSSKCSSKSCSGSAAWVVLGFSQMFNSVALDVVELVSIEAETKDGKRVIELRFSCFPLSSLVLLLSPYTQVLSACLGSDTDNPPDQPSGPTRTPRRSAEWSNRDSRVVQLFPLMWTSSTATIPHTDSSRMALQLAEHWPLLTGGAECLRRVPCTLSCTAFCTRHT